MSARSGSAEEIRAKVVELADRLERDQPSVPLLESRLQELVAELACGEPGVEARLLGVMPKIDSGELQGEFGKRVREVWVR
ncbi:hypothetical protein [Streptomyces misionensis]|uniref:hypothetical protein n=1 Tax=Streptomyces misionensis TaxID=67331 RepID=UPI0033A92398